MHENSVPHVTPALCIVCEACLMSVLLSVQLLAFESYRDLVRMLQQNLTEEQGLIAAELQNIEERASARSAAAAAIGLAAGQSSGPAASAAPAGVCHTLLALARSSPVSPFVHV